MWTRVKHDVQFLGLLFGGMLFMGVVLAVVLSPFIILLKFALTFEQ